MKNYLKSFLVLCFMLAYFTQHNYAQELDVEIANKFIPLFSQATEDYNSRKLSKALDEFIQCHNLLIDNNISDKETLMIVNQFLGRIHTDLGNYKLAESHYLQALKYGEEFKSHKGYRYVLSGLSVLYTNLHDYDKALEYGMETKYYYEKYNDLA